MVVLLGGGHSVGVAHCGFFRDRLFDFRSTTMDSVLREKLARHCGEAVRPGARDPVAFLDQGTPFLVDNELYDQIVRRRGVLQIDQELALDNSTAGIVESLRKDKRGFLKKFGEALVKLGSVHVLEGEKGEIRRICGVVNG